MLGRAERGLRRIAALTGLGRIADFMLWVPGNVKIPVRWRRRGGPLGLSWKLGSRPRRAGIWANSLLFASGSGGCADFIFRPINRE
eukprot:15435694-Alexandrium_andersonii.AAC.1